MLPIMLKLILFCNVVFETIIVYSVLSKVEIPGLKINSLFGV